MALLLHIRHFLGADALVHASMLVISTAALADDFPAGSFAHPTGILDIASCDDLAYCGISADVTPAIPIDVASVPASENRRNCSDRPAWMEVQQSDGSIHPERLPACNARRYDPGWRHIRRA